ncbi:hypothetical protein ACJMK2_024753 [Sinanodonta woodiana]|uniref:Uncharacterized protein n=1 Tax=Sinanodonta woodiana TaxID=1069815 RepID=A0ABD3XG82_SINWO
MDSTSDEQNQLVQNTEAEQTSGHDESEQQVTELMEYNKINTDELYQVNTYVAAIYESRWYVGQVLEYDKDDQEYNINFMVAGKKLFQMACETRSHLDTKFRRIVLIG